MGIWPWIVKLWLGDEHQFVASMKSHPYRTIFRTIILIVICLSCVYVLAFIGQFAINHANAKNGRETNVLPVPAPLVSQQANSNSSSTVSQVANINQQGKYIWVNEKTWTAIAQEGVASGKYQVNLVFVVSGGIPPPTPCFYLRSDAALDSVGPIGVSSQWAQGTTKDGTNVRCYLALANSVTFQVMLKSKPKFLETALVQDDAGLRVQTQPESSFQIPIVN